MSQNTQSFYLLPNVSKAKNIAAAGNTQVKTGSGSFNGLSINTGAASSSITLYDGTSASGTKLGAWSTTTQGILPSINIGFTTGLFAVVAGSPDVTVLFT